MLKSMLVQRVYAGTAVPTDPIQGNVFGEDVTFAGIFTFATNLLIILGLGLVLIFLALGFIKFITSRGDKVETDLAQKWVTYAVIGGVGLFLVYAVKSIILNLVDAPDPLGIE